MQPFIYAHMHTATICVFVCMYVCVCVDRQFALLVMFSKSQRTGSRHHGKSCKGTGADEGADARLAPI